MGNQMIWQDRFDIGVEVIDREHRKLFNIINKLLSLSEHELKSQWVCQEGIKYFKDHAMNHFSEEEVYMASINYEGYEAHRRLHDNFRQKTLPELEKELQQTGYAPESISHFIGVCAGWLIGHTLTEDQAITGKSISRWNNLMPEEEQIAVRKAITRLLYDMFRLEAKVVTDYYGGEKFGKGIYYRLVFAKNNETEWDFILVFEEKLLINTMGKMLEPSSEKLSAMIVNATRYAAKQFVERIREHFPYADQYELIEENLLSYAQFEKIFEADKPQCSLLFDTGEGYFAYCSVSPHLLSGKNHMGKIHEEHATDEIQEYLKKEEKEQKKKILLVDDSKVVLKAMENLLGGDYQIATASSGLSALRCLALNRPDLVLLDYEMPSFDGRQLLEMIRSEKDFADQAVIFLTSRMDRESVEKIKDLKPAGYLIKTMQPAAIKKTIDDYFKKKR